MSMNILNDISQVYLEQVSDKPDFLDLDKDGNKKEPMKKAAKEVEAPKERLKTDRNMFNIPKGEQEAARERLLAKARAKREKMEESLRLVQEKKMSKEAHKKAAKAGKRWQDSDGDGKWYEPGEDVKESSDYDPMDDDDFDPNEAEENRGVSGKNNPKGGKSIFKKKKKDVKEGFSNWRQDLSEVMDDIEANKKVKEKNVSNNIKTSAMGSGIKLGEAVDQLGGELVEMVELDEKAYRGLGVGRVERVSSGSYQAPETTGSAAKRKPKTDKPVETKKPAALPPEQGRRARKRRKGSPSYAEVKAQIDAKEKSRKPRKSKRSRLDSLLASIRNEEVQQIDELSVNKMLDYKKKAEKDRDRLNKKWDQGTATPKERKKVFDREEGEERASRRIEKKTGKHPYDMNVLDKLKASVKKEEVQIDERRRDAINQMNSYELEGDLVDEKMNMKKAEMGDVIKDFYKSDAPQFKGKSKEKRREMAIAAKLTAERGGKKLGEEIVVEKDEKIEAKFKGARTPHLLDKFRQEHPGSRQPKKKRGDKETPEERQSRLTNTQVRRAVKYGLTKKQKGETESRKKYYSSRD